jgi:hypothetical protein
MLCHRLEDGRHESLVVAVVHHELLAPLQVHRFPAVAQQQLQLVDRDPPVSQRHIG